MTIGLRHSRWAIDRVGPSTRSRRGGISVQRPRAPQGPRATPARVSLPTADGLPLRWLESLRRGWARLLAPRDQDAASLARRFESQMPNLAAELRYFAALDSMHERRGGR